MFSVAFVCLSVCLSVSNIAQKAMNRVLRQVCLLTLAVLNF